VASDSALVASDLVPADSSQVAADSVATADNTTAADSMAADRAAPDSTTLAQRRQRPPAGTLPPYTQDEESLVASYLDDADTGLPPSPDFPTEDASSRLTLEGVFPPTVGVSAGGPFGGGVSGGVGFRFSDMLGNQQLDVIAQANGTFRDIGGAVSYLNRGNRLNYGASGSHVPIPYNRAFDINALGQVSIITQRLFITQASFNTSYPLNTVRRFEAGIGGIRYGFGTNVRGPAEDRLEGQIRDPENEIFAQSNLAYVVDFSNFGLTSPVRGGRYRFQVSPKVGTQTFVGALVDLRRYLYAKPFTFAVQGVHLGNYGAGSDDIFADEFLGYSTSQAFVRGYGFRSFDEAADCVDRAAGGGSVCQADFNRLVGTRVLKTSAEIRIPLLGVQPLSLLQFPYLPTEVALFTDAGVAWTADDPFEFRFDENTLDRVPVVSSGVALRVNMLGSLILEPYWAYAFQRAQPSTFGLRFQPGW
jgi:hypothetical protein